MHEMPSLCKKSYNTGAFTMYVNDCKSLVPKPHGKGKSRYYDKK